LGGPGQLDQARVNEMVDLAIKDLIYDDEFIGALDEKVSVSSTVTAILDNQTVDQKQK
jgi:hypothetical protein